MTLFRGYADDRPLMEWLTQYIWPVEKRMTDDDVYWGTRLGLRRDDPHRDHELLGHVLARRGDREGGRGRRRSRGHGGAADRRLRRGKSERACADAQRSLDRIIEAGGELARPGFAPHAIYSLSERSLRWVAERAAELELPVQIHLSETEDEVIDCVDEHGERPAAYLDRVGLLGPRTRARPRRAGSTAPSSS